MSGRESTMSLFGVEEQQKIEKLKEALNSWQNGYNNLKLNYDALIEKEKKLQQEYYKCNDKAHKSFLQHQEHNKNQTAIIDNLTKQKKDLETTLYDQQVGQSAAINSAIEDTRHQYIRTIEQQQTEINELQRLVDTNRTEFALLSQSIQWVKLAEVDGEIGYRGILPDGGIYKSTIIRVKQKHLKEIPVSIDGADEVYEDGLRYPIALMDSIRGIPITPLIKQNTVKYPLSIKEESSVKDNDVDKDSELKETPNEKKVMEFISKYPGSFQKDISSGLNIDKGTVSKVIKSLVEKTIIIEGEEGGFELS